MTDSIELTPWIGFCRTLTIALTPIEHPLPMSYVTHMTDLETNLTAACLGMLPLPEGHAFGLPDLAAQWIAEGAA